MVAVCYSNYCIVDGFKNYTSYRCGNQTEELNKQGETNVLQENDR